MPLKYTNLIRFIAVIIIAGWAITRIFWMRHENSSEPGKQLNQPSQSTYDLDGNAVDPLANSTGRCVVLIFIKTDCPISNRYAPEIRRLHDDYAARGMTVWVVYPDAESSDKELLKHQLEFQLPSRALRDPAQKLVALSQAKVTPEAAVFIPGKGLVYHGRIDNRHVDFGSSRPEATENTLRQVLGQIDKGEQVTIASTRAVGCYIAPIR